MPHHERVAIVTGGGQGIGEAISVSFARAGVDVAVADIDLECAQRVVRKIEESSARGLAIQMDVAKLPQVECMTKEVLSRFGRVDILVNNAGISPRNPKGGRTPVYEISDDEWQRVLDVNLTGAFYCSRAVIPVMIQNKKGWIVNISSSVGKTGSGEGSSGAHYAASKAGLISLTKSMARELAEHAISVNAICPGLVETALRATASVEVNRKLRAGIPLKRFARPEEIASVALFLVSEAASYITGEIVDVNGGLLID